jgi:hypothetical protein
MAGASNGRTENSSVSRKLNPIVVQLPEITSYFNAMQQLVEDEILTQEESDVVTDAYKSTVAAQITAIEAEEEAHGVDVGNAGVIETNDACEGIVAVAANGSPVITPLPAALGIVKTTLLADEATFAAEVVAKKAQINAVIG